MMQITARTSGQKPWNSNQLSLCESGLFPEGVILVCIHGSQEVPDTGTTVIVDWDELVRVLRAIEAATKASPR